MIKKFNLSKIAVETVLPNEKRNIELRQNMDNHAIDDPGTYEYRLKDVRKHPEGDATYQKLLQDKRTAQSGQGITEYALNNKKKTINDMDVRSDKMNNTPLMDYSIKADNDLSDKIIKEEKKEDRDVSFWDDYIGEQMLGEVTKIVDNHQNSQMVTNYKTRDEFNKKNKVIAGKLKDADAMIYSIYRQSFDEKRGLSEKEKQIIDDVNSGKIRVLSQFTPGGEFSDEMLRQDLAQESLDRRLKEIEGIEEDKIDIEEDDLEKEVDQDKSLAQPLNLKSF